MPNTALLTAALSCAKKRNDIRRLRILTHAAITARVECWGTWKTWGTCVQLSGRQTKPWRASWSGSVCWTQCHLTSGMPPGCEQNAGCVDMTFRLSIAFSLLPLPGGICSARGKSSMGLLSRKRADILCGLATRTEFEKICWHVSRLSSAHNSTNSTN